MVENKIVAYGGGDSRGGHGIQYDVDAHESMEKVAYSSAWKAECKDQPFANVHHIHPMSSHGNDSIHHDGEAHEEVHEEVHEGGREREEW
mmetsp:Transcript_41374/g.46733  ORF Transcript_41374/g.46733 Transcript_41374/m.46733 type:complete len:90 (-) Transcript_41374:38-307(-)